MNPKVSIIIPAFNRADVIGRAIKSALIQSMRDIEVIVVDDGSTDATVEVVRQFSDERVRLLQHDRNRGAAAARNSAIAVARGDLIALLDSDDAWEPGKLEAQVDILADNTDVDAVICGVHLRLIDQGRAFGVIPTRSDDWLKRLLADCDLNAGATLVARRAVIEAVGPMDENLSRFEDWDWLVRYVSSGGRIEVAPEILATVNNRRGRLGRESERSAERFLAKYKTLRSRYGAAFSRRVEVDIWMQVAGTYAFAKEWMNFARIFARAAWKSPLYCVGRSVRAAARFGSRLDDLNKSG